MNALDSRAPLLTGVSQYDVDFVIPRVGIDVPVGIDPFLLYKSRDPDYRELHKSLVDVFNTGIEMVKRGLVDRARKLLDFPEVSAIGMGYTKRGKRGSGVGTHLAGLIVETLLHSPSLQERGIRHVEEMQLVSAGIGPDRVSDIAANILKTFLISYTQKQCRIWNIELKSNVPVSHIYNRDSKEWEDSHADLPVSAVDFSPILLVPRSLVRTLPWINYDDFIKTEFNAYLAAKRSAIRSSKASEAINNQLPQETTSKPQVVSVTRGDIGIVERYVKSREQMASQARPAIDYVDEDACKEAARLKAQLAKIEPGQKDATKYQRLVLEILNFLFNPELIDGQPEVRTIDGTERRDIIFTNDSDERFWDYLRNEHNAIFVMFEAKNTKALELSHINQTSTYLGERIGRFGVIVTRQPATEEIQRKINSVWNDSTPRKVILVLHDADVSHLLDIRCEGGSPTKWMQNHYRKFKMALQ
jgi:hypothetical protein